ncbi:unnamed protein product [Caenorhabditis bovis]|uniref:Uncharacterized protein n=1 Tax=Caenorhabditis bovis TaxID=2654633 RepID=A0A8S1F4A4_9PELO|nr:unnamed protein product [Caenorhabditis bovis]
MAQPMDSLITDEFEVIGFDEQDGESNEDELWSVQQSIRIDPETMQMPHDLPFSAIRTIHAESLKNETPILVDSLGVETPKESLATEDKESTPKASLNPEMSIVSPSECSTDKNSLAEIDAIDSAENDLRMSLIYVEQLKKQLNAQATKIAELEQNEAIRKEMIKLEEANLEKARADIQATFEIEKKKFEAELESSRNEVQSLKDELAAARQSIEIYQTNLEKMTDNNHESLMEENENLKKQLSEQAAKYYEELELRQMLEHQVSSMQTGASCFDPPYAIISRELANKTEYALKLEDEIMMLRDKVATMDIQMKCMNMDIDNQKMIVDLLREDQIESTRELAERDQKIEQLEHLCRRTALIDNDFA